MHAHSIVAKRRRQSHLAQCAVSSSPSLLVLPLRRQWDGLPFPFKRGRRRTTQVVAAQGRSRAPCAPPGGQTTAQREQARRSGGAPHGAPQQSAVRARTMDGAPALALTCTAPRDAIGRIIADVRPGSCGGWTPAPACAPRIPVRPSRDVKGVVAVGNGPDHVYFDVALDASTGSVRVGVCLARILLDRVALMRWSVPELALLFFLNNGVPREFGLRNGTRWCDCVNLLGDGPIAKKLSELTGHEHARVDVVAAMSCLNEHMCKAKAARRSCLLDGSLVRLLPCLTVDDGEDIGAGNVDCPEGTTMSSFSALLRGTAVERAAHAQSNAAWRRQESILTTVRDAAGVRRRRQVGSEWLSSIDKADLALLRHRKCRFEIKMPVLHCIYGENVGKEQLFMCLSSRDRSTPIAVESDSSGPERENWNLGWKKQAERTISQCYRTVEGVRLLQPALSACVLRSLLSLRFGRVVQELDLVCPVVESVEWVLDKLGAMCASGRAVVAVAPRADEIIQYLRYVAHSAEIAGRLWVLERADAESCVPAALSIVAEFDRDDLGISDVIGVAPVFLVESGSGATVTALYHHNSPLDIGDVVLRLDDVDLCGLPRPIMDLMWCGPVGTLRSVDVLRDGSVETVHVALVSLEEACSWKSTARAGQQDSERLLVAQANLWKSVVAAAGKAYGHGRYPRCVACGQTRILLTSLHDATRQLLRTHRQEVAGSVCEQFRRCGVPAVVESDALGAWSVVLPQPQHLAAGSIAAVGRLMEAHWQPPGLPKAMGFCVELSSALSHLLLEIVLGGGLSEFALTAKAGMRFSLKLCALGPADGGSVGRRFMWHLLFSIRNCVGDMQSGSAFLRTSTPVICAHWLKVYLQEKHAAPRTLHLWLPQIDRALGYDFLVPVPGTDVVHTINFVLDDIQMCDSPMASFYGGCEYMNAKFGSPSTGCPRSNFTRRNTVAQTLVTLGDRHKLWLGVQRWVEQRTSEIPTVVTGDRRTEALAAIQRYARLHFMNTMDCPGPLRHVPGVAAETADAIKTRVVHGDPLHGAAALLKNMTYIAEHDACDYDVDASGHRRVCPQSHTRALQAVKDRFRAHQSCTARQRDQLWAQNTKEVMERRHEIYGDNTSNLFLSTADVLMIAIRLTSAGYRTLRNKQFVALRELVTLAHSVGFRALCAMKPPDSKEYKSGWAIHNQIFALSGEYTDHNGQLVEFVGRNHSAQRTEGEVHDARAHVKDRGARWVEGTFASYVENTAIRRSTSGGSYGRAFDQEDASEARGLPTALLFEACVCGFDKRSMREFICTLERLSPDSRGFVFAEPARHGILWVSTALMAMEASRDPGWTPPGCDRVCFCPDKHHPNHDCAWMDSGRESTLASYLRPPFVIPLGNTAQIRQQLVDLNLMSSDGLLDEHTGPLPEDLVVQEWFCAYIIAWWDEQEKGDSPLEVPDCVRHMRAAYKAAAAQAGTEVGEPQHYELDEDMIARVRSGLAAKKLAKRQQQEARLLEQERKKRKKEEDKIEKQREKEEQAAEDKRQRLLARSQKKTDRDAQRVRQETVQKSAHTAASSDNSNGAPAARKLLQTPRTATTKRGSAAQAGVEARGAYAKTYTTTSRLRGTRSSISKTASLSQTSATAKRSK